MNVDLTPRQVEVLRGAVALRIETASEQVIEPAACDDGGRRSLPKWCKEHNADIQRELAILDRILAKLT